MKTGKAIKLSVIMLLVLIQTGCKLTFLGRAEINNIEFIRVIGIDKAPGKEGYVRLTIATQRIQAEAVSGQKKKPNIIVSEGRTVFEAVRNFWNHMDKRPFWGHVEYVLIGEEAAKDGLLKYIDFFSRDPEIRLNLKVYETMGSSAEEIMYYGGGEDRFIFDQLKGVTENQSGQSVINVVDLVEVMYILDKEYLSLYLPCIELQNKTKQNSDMETLDIAMSGFALFEGDKLAGHLDREMGRGLNWLRNKIATGVIVVTSPKGNPVSLEIIESNVKLKPSLSEKKPAVQVNAYASANIAEIQVNEDILTKEDLTFLEKKLEKSIRDEIERVIRLAQEKEIDIVGAGDAFFKKYPIQWEDELQKTWKTTFSEIAFQVDVSTVIIGTYNISQPNRSGKGDGE